MAGGDWSALRIPNSLPTLPADMLVPLLPGADHPDMPVNSLMRFRGAWEPEGLPTDVVGPGSIVICRNDDGSSFSGARLPFLMGICFDAGADYRAGKVLVSWMVPSKNPRAAFGMGGRKKMVVDVFSAWESIDQRRLDPANIVCFPSPLVPLGQLIACNVQLEQGHISFQTLHELKQNHGVDVTALTFSETDRGNLYRTWETMHLGR